MGVAFLARWLTARPRCPRAAESQAGGSPCFAPCTPQGEELPMPYMAKGVWDEKKGVVRYRLDTQSGVWESH